jgi:hypothetical protein
MITALHIILSRRVQGFEADAARPAALRNPDRKIKFWDMSTITAILEADADGTLHLPLPAELRHGKIEVTATLKAATETSSTLARATPEMVARRKAALRELRGLGGLRDVIPDPAAWQRETRQDRPLPGRD